jgi:hypothetical protein
MPGEDPVSERWVIYDMRSLHVPQGEPAFGPMSTEEKDRFLASAAGTLREGAYWPQEVKS